MYNLIMVDNTDTITKKNHLYMNWLNAAKNTKPIQQIAKNRFNEFYTPKDINNIKERIEYRDVFINEWADSDLPIFIRKFPIWEAVRWDIVKINGIKCILADNAPAQKIYYDVLYANGNLKEKFWDLKENFPFFLEDKNKKNKNTNRLTKMINNKWLKLCHIKSIWLNTTINSKNIQNLKKINLCDKWITVDVLNKSQLKNHFINFMSPKNMFVLPLEIWGLWEIEPFIQKMKELLGLDVIWEK